MTEATFSKRIVKILKEGGAFVRRVENLCDSGFPDIIAIYNGQTVFLELKARKGSLRPTQIAWHRQAATKNIPVYIVKHKDEEILVKRLDAEGNISTVTLFENTRFNLKTELFNLFPVRSECETTGNASLLAR